MENIFNTANDLQNFIINWLENYKEAPFDCEYDFQLSLAFEFKEKDKNLKIGFEKYIYTPEISTSTPKRCDITVRTQNGKNIFIELKYINHDKKHQKSSYNSRISFIENIKRLKNDIYNPQNEFDKNSKKYCIFLTNKPVIFEPKKVIDEKWHDYVKEFHKNFTNEENHWQNVNGINFKGFKILVADADNYNF